MRTGWFRFVHVKSPESQELRLLLTHRKTLQRKALDIENEIRGTLKAFGLKVGKASRGRFAPRVRELVADRARLRAVTEPMLKARAALMAEFDRPHRMVLEVVRGDPLCPELGPEGLGHADRQDTGGLKRAKFALARKLAVIMHRMWLDGSEFRWSDKASTPRALRFAEGTKT